MTVLPGPSAVETALVASGLAGAQYRFVGYLPRSERERAALWQELDAWPHPTVAFESPKRLPATLASLAAVEPDRLVAVCRELTKAFEEVVCETAAALAERYREPPKGEVTLVIGPSTRAADASAAVAAVVELVAAGSTARRRGERRRAAHRRPAQHALRRLAVAQLVSCRHI